MEFHGREYVIDYCMSYLRQYTKDRIYKSYIADNLKLLNELISSAFGGSVTLDRYEDRIAKIEARKQDTKPERSAEEIKNSVFDRIEEISVLANTSE